MLHARTDYQGIQDATGTTTIAEGEPVFLLRAKDHFAPSTLRYWADRLETVGGCQVTVKHVRDWARLMERWQAEHGSKIPDASADVHQVIG